LASKVPEISAEVRGSLRQSHGKSGEPDFVISHQGEDSKR